MAISSASTGLRPREQRPWRSSTRAAGGEHRSPARRVAERPASSRARGQPPSLQRAAGREFSFHLIEQRLGLPLRQRVVNVWFVSSRRAAVHGGRRAALSITGQ
ncbi:hypothetical protein Dimus_039091 [Dionaea muscipula]